MQKNSISLKMSLTINGLALTKAKDEQSCDVLYQTAINASSEISPLSYMSVKLYTCSENVPFGRYNIIIMKI